MKKTLAIAIAAGLAAPMAVMADTTLYGSAHVSLDSIDLDGANGTNTGLSSNKSYLGIKGSEKISDGLSAVYKAEFGVGFGNPGSSSLSNRDQWVGLKGSAGTVLAGRKSTPFKGIGAKADLFWYSQLGSQRTINGDDRRVDNMIAYTTPKLGGFSATYQHVFEEDNDGNDSDSASATYKAGGLLVGLGLENRGGNDDTDTRLMASYDTGKFKVVGFLENVNPAGSAADRDVAGIGAAMKTAKGTIKGQYYTTSFDVPAATGSDGSLFALGYDHNLSKRTVAYAIIAATDQDAGLAGLTLGSGGGHSENVTAGAGEGQSGVSLGVRHKF